MKRLIPLVLIAVLMFPLTVAGKGGGGGGFSSSGTGRSGGFSSSSPSRSYTPSTPNTRPQAGTFTSKGSGMSSQPAIDSHRAGERATSVYVHRSTTVVNNGGGGSSWLLPAFLGYAAGGGCNRDRRTQENQP